MGIHPEDFRLAFIRHATSKISQIEDLESLSSLGFRGEALASIAAVSDVHLESRRIGHAQSFIYRSEDQSISPSPRTEFLFQDHGTRIEVLSLFSKTPARYKFLKSPSAEVQSCKEWVEKLALSRPQAGFQLWNDGKEILNIPAPIVPDSPSAQKIRIENLLGLPQENHWVHAEHVNELGTLKLHWLVGASVPHGRKLIQMVNGRVLKDRWIQQAISLALKQVFLPGQYPILVLELELQPSEVDWNVHPHKTEVRFSNSSVLFQWIRHSIQASLERTPLSRTIGSDTASEFSPSSFSPTASVSGTAHSSSPFTPRQSFQTTPVEKTLPFSFSSPQPSAQNTVTATPDSGKSIFLKLTADRYTGTLFQTYFMYELENEVILIDQHAAHERIRYEFLKKKALATDFENSNQSLLLPEAVDFSFSTREIEEEAFHLLEKLGFQAESLGPAGILFRSLPTLWNGPGLRARLFSLLERIQEALHESAEGLTSTAHTSSAELLWDSALFEKIASESCRSSVMAGDVLQLPQIQSLIERLGKCEHPWNCPHGRLVMTRVGKSQVESWFQRKI